MMRAPRDEQLKMMAKRGYIPAKDAAEKLCVAGITIHRYVETGELDGEWLGRRLYVAAKSVEKMLPPTIRR